MVSNFLCGSGSKSGALCNMRYLSEAYLKLKSCEVLLAHSLFHICPMVLKYYILHNSDTDVLCAIYHKHLKTDRILWTNEILRDLSLR